jgi:hypothetical protein
MKGHDQDVEVSQKVSWQKLAETCRNIVTLHLRGQHWGFRAQASRWKSREHTYLEIRMPLENIE